MKTRWLVVALIVSVVVNLALVGFLIGVSGKPPAWRPGGFDAAAGLGRLIRFLPEERRSEVLGPIGKDGLRREARGSFRTMRRAQHGIAEALAAEPFDPDKLDAALAAFRDQFDLSQQRSHAAFVTIMEMLTPEERRRFVETMRHMRDPGRDRGRRPEGRRRGDRPRDR